MGVAGARPNILAARTEASHRVMPDSATAVGTVTHLAPPAELSDLGRDVWPVLIEPLIDAKVVRPEDIILLVEAAEAWAFVYHFRRALWAEINGANDSNEVKRLRSGWAQSLGHAKSLAGDLGIGPVNRVRLGLLKPGGAGLLDGLFDGVDE